MIVEELTQREYTQHTEPCLVDYTFHEKLKYSDIYVKSLTLSNRLLEANLPRKYAMQAITGNEYGFILVEQPIIPAFNDNRIAIEIPMMQNLSALRGCMRIGIVSKQRAQETNFILKGFKNHGCFMISQDGLILHDQDETQNMKKTDFSLMEKDVLQLIYDGESKSFSIENHSANTVHTLHNINLEPLTNPDNHDQSGELSSTEEEIQQQKQVSLNQKGLQENCSFLSSLSNQKMTFHSNQQLDSQRSKRTYFQQFDEISEEEYPEEQSNTFHFAFMMGIGPSKIQIL